MNTRIYLDLEDTIIREWYQPDVINVDRINRWLDTCFRERPTEIVIFSFAIWNEQDKKNFRDYKIKALVEDALSVEIVDWPSIQDLRKVIEPWSKVVYEDDREFALIEGKAGAFVKMCLANGFSGNYILIDDAVPDQTIVDHGLGLTMRLLPVSAI